MQIRLLALIVIMAVLSACADTAPTTTEPNSTPDTSTQAEDGTPDISNAIDDSTAATLTAQPTLTPLPTFAPTLTPQATDGLPSIELVSGRPDSCANNNAFTNLLSFDVIYNDMTTANLVAYRLISSGGDVLFEDSSLGENRDGAGAWGIYPDVYEVDAQSVLVLEVTVYAGETDASRITSTSSLIFNCTTGEVISTTFATNPAEDE